jgi:hypothetical protein
VLVDVDLETRQVALLERDDFGSLKLVARNGDELARLIDVLEGQARPAENDHVWLAAAALETWADDPDPGWRSSYRAMLDKVKLYGWYDDATDEVKAHIDWA